MLTEHTRPTLTSPHMPIVLAVGCAPALLARSRLMKVPAVMSGSTEPNTTSEGAHTSAMASAVCRAEASAVRKAIVPTGR